jgi:hypothetical protein
VLEEVINTAHAAADMASAALAAMIGTFARLMRVLAVLRSA